MPTTDALRDESRPSSDEMNSIRQFVLQAENPALRYPVIEAKIRVADLGALRAILGDNASDDPDLRCSYAMDSDELAAVADKFGVKIDAGDRTVLLTPWHPVREAPYLNHAGFELPLMLKGRKPFAKFSDGFPSEWFDSLLAAFDSFVADGRIIRRTVERPFSTPFRQPDGTLLEGMRQVYFALPGQEWRIDVNLLLFEVGSNAGWSEALERFEGLLLGYEDWQNDWHIAKLRASGQTDRWLELPNAFSDDSALPLDAAQALRGARRIWMEQTSTPTNTRTCDMLGAQSSSFTPCSQPHPAPWRRAKAPACPSAFPASVFSSLCCCVDRSSPWRTLLLDFKRDAWDVND